MPPLATQAARLAANVKDQPGLERIREMCYLRSRSLEEALGRARSLDFNAPRSAIEDLTASFPEKYSKTNLNRFDALQKAVTSARNRFPPDKLET